MPPQNGRQFYDRLSVHPQLAPIPVIFITALPPGEADRRLIGDLQHVPVLYKPIQVPELLTAVEMFIDHGP